MSAQGSSGPTLEGKMHFLAREPKYQTEKPYTLRFKPDPASGIPQTNIARVEHTLRFRDMRGRLSAGPAAGNSDDPLVYDECGFTVTALPGGGAMAYDDYADRDKLETVHAAEVLAAVENCLGAREAQLIDYVVRRRHPEWPIATGEAYDFQQPASRAHIDHTYAGGVAVIREAHGEKADLVLERKWQLVNVWHPLQGPLVDWPLAVCDARTVDFANDSMAGDVVDRNQAFENTQVHHNPAQEWYYLSGQMPHELVLFKNADSEEPAGATPGVPHASFDNPLKTDSDFRRESIEMRVLVLF